MTTQLITIGPEDSVSSAKEIMDARHIHHIPVIAATKEIIGIISHNDIRNLQNIENRKVEEIMTKGLAKVESTDPLRTAVDVFSLNRFRAIPVVDNGKLVGIITTQDIIKKIASEPIKLEDYQTKDDV